MSKIILKTLILAISILAGFDAVGQNQKLWTLNDKEGSQNQIRKIPVNQAKYYVLEVDQLDQSLKSVSKSTNKTITVPYPDGTVGEFLLTETPVMSDKLAAKYPNIKTYTGRNLKTGDVIRMDLTPKGFHGMVFSKEGQFFIDPVKNGDNKGYQVYYRKDLEQTEKSRSFEEGEPIIYNRAAFEAVKQKVETGNFSRPAGDELRTYRLAVAATGEYTQFHGGTVADALAAIVTTINRVSGIYEKNVAIKFILVDNNDQIIFTDGDTDPFSNNDAGAMLNELQTEIDEIIGSSNYDVGHGFTTGAGGLAQLGAICTSSKAKGVTGTNNPVGDPFDVDYVAHEIGHQFGAPHTFNGEVGSCSGNNRNSNTAYEPGSGTTIMAYAGICGSDNIQNNSDAYFHVNSLDYINAYSQDANGNTCAEITNTGNNLPIVNAGTGGFTIPVNTPFQLNGSASDPDGDEISYVWEQFNLGPAGSPNSPVDNAPIFRTFAPTADSFRIFPQISDVINGTQTIGELLPTYSRDLTFRLIARDNQIVSGVDYDEISFTATEDAGPFLVGDISGSFNGLSTLSVSWDVANTNVAPVNSQLVNIYLSLDGGQSFTELLKENTPNDGSENVTLTNVNTSTARIKVAAADNIFFNISSSNFSITETTDPTYNFTVNFNKEKYCPEDNIVITINTESFFNYNEVISFSTANLPPGFNASFSNSTVLPGESTILTINNTAVSTGMVSFGINTSSGSITKNESVSAVILNNPVAPTIVSPTDNSSTEGVLPFINWESDNLEALYDLQIATDINFSNIVESVADYNQTSYTPKSLLNGNTQYFIRLKAKNLCGESPYAEVNFTTKDFVCFSRTSADVPITIPTSAATVRSTLTIAESGTIDFISLQNLKITHSYISDLVITLQSPLGTEVVLIDKICGGENDFNLSLSDIAEASNLPCPPIDGGVYNPLSPLSPFIGEDMRGDWTLIISDVVDQDGGNLTNWELEICATGVDLPPAKPEAFSLSYAGDANVLLSWSDVADDETAYIVERSVVGNEKFEIIANLAKNSTSYQDKLPDLNSTYQYRVYAVRDGLNSNYTEVLEASISILSNQDELDKEIVIFPNPAKNIINIRNTSNEFINKIRINNSLGQAVKIIEGNPTSVDLNGIPSGIYFIHIEINKKHIVKQIVIQN